MGRILIVINNPDKIDPETDSSLFIADMLSRNSDIDIGISESITVTHACAQIKKVKFNKHDTKGLLFKNAEFSVFTPEYYDRIMYRTDIPQNVNYFQTIQLLDAILGDHSEKKVINPLSLLLTSTSKLELLKIHNDYRPQYIISSDQKQILAWLKKNTSAIIKPVNSFLSRGVKSITLADYDEYFSKHHSTSSFFIIEKIIPNFWEREIRVWFINHRFLFAVRKIYDSNEILDGEHCQIESCELTNQEKEVVKYLENFLRKRNIKMAGVDLIHGFITDINFESPGLLKEGTHLYSMQNLVREQLLAIAYDNK